MCDVAHSCKELRTISAYLQKRGIRKLQQIEVNGYAGKKPHLVTNICLDDQNSVIEHCRSVEGKLTGEAHERKSQLKCC